MLYTNLTHLETAADLGNMIAGNESLLVVCGKMDPQCVPVYRVAEELESSYPEVRFCDMEFDNPESQILRNLPEVENFDSIPFTVYYQNGSVVKATSGIQTNAQISGNINELFLKTEKV
jgi:thioredoxin 1